LHPPRGPASFLTATLDIPKVAEWRRRADDFCHGDHKSW